MDATLHMIRQAHDGNTGVEERLIEQNIGLVHRIAKRFVYSGIDYEDLVQIGSLGLLKAIRNFDVDRGVMLSTYAVPMIIGEIRKYLRDDGAVKVSRTIREQYIRLRRMSQQIQLQTERDPTVSELAQACGLSEEEVVLALDAGASPVSLDETVNEDGDVARLELVCAPEHLSSVERIALKDVINALPPKDRALITLRYFCEKTQQQTALQLGMTQVQVSRREKKILEKLRTGLS